MSLRNRLRRLEGGRGDYCPECGGSGATDSLGNPIEIEVVWEDPATEEEIQELRSWFERGMPEEEVPEDPQDEYCERCGRRTLTIIDWPDALPPRERKRLEAEMLANRGWSLDALLGKPSSQDGSSAIAQVPDYPPTGWEKLRERNRDDERRRT
jgi:hypothetical protein